MKKYSLLVRGYIRKCMPYVTDKKRVRDDFCANFFEALDTLTEKERKMILDTYATRNAFIVVVQEVSAKYNVSVNYIWKLANRFEREIAERCGWD